MNPFNISVSTTVQNIIKPYEDMEVFRNALIFEQLTMYH